MFEGQAESAKRLNLLYDGAERPFHVITNLTGAMAKRYVCKACHKVCTREITQSVTIRLAIARSVCRALSPMFVSPSPNAKDILEAGHFTITTCKTLYRKVRFANVNVVAQRVHGS